MTDKMVVALAPLGGGVVALVTDGNQHSVFRRTQGAWSSWRNWEGDRISAFCSCGDSIVCCEPLGLIRVSGADEFQVEDPRHTWYHAALSTASGEVLLGGRRGAIGILDIPRRSLRTTSLAERGIRKPGRDILGIAGLGDDHVLVGQNRLMARLQGDSYVELLDPNEPTAERVDLYYAVRSGARLWASGLRGVSPAVAVITNGSLELAAHPAIGPAAPPLFVRDGVTYLLDESIWVSVGTDWREDEGGVGESFVAMEVDGEDLVAITENGSCFQKTAGSWLAVAGVEVELS